MPFFFRYYFILLFSLLLCHYYATYFIIHFHCFAIIAFIISLLHYWFLRRFHYFIIHAYITYAIIIFSPLISHFIISLHYFFIISIIFALCHAIITLSPATPYIFTPWLLCHIYAAYFIICSLRLCRLLFSYAIYAIISCHYFHYYYFRHADITLFTLSLFSPPLSLRFRLCLLAIIYYAIILFHFIISPFSFHYISFIFITIISFRHYFRHAASLFIFILMPLFSPFSLHFH